MIAIAAALAITQGGHFAQWFPNPTGQNGYEEFLQAADVIERAGDPTIWNAASLDLEKSRELVAKYGTAFDLIERGLRKPMRAPWNPLDPGEDYVFATLDLVALSEFMESRIRVLVADGRPSAAAESIVLALNYADRAAENDAFEALCGALGRQVIFDSFAQFVHKLPVTDLPKVRSTFLRSLNGKPKVLSAMRAQLTANETHIEEFLNRERDPEEFEAVPFTQLTPEQKADYKARITSALDVYQSQLDEMFTKEERYWHDLRYEDGDPLVEYGVYMMYPFPCAEAVVLDRTKARIAAHYCSVMEYKRTHNHLPNSLMEVGSVEQFHDPVSGEQFVYRKDSEQSFFIFSKGNEWTGPIHLRTQMSEIDQLRNESVWRKSVEHWAK